MRRHSGKMKTGEANAGRKLIQHMNRAGKLCRRGFRAVQKKVFSV